MTTRNISVDFIKNKMSKNDVGRLGGLARQAKHGNLGTLEGRRLGGLRSQLTHQKNNTGFSRLKSVRFPRRSAKLAELCGILAGDGHIGKYQVSMTTNSETDMQHALYVRDLFIGLFHVSAQITMRKKSKACVVVVSSKRIVEFLCAQGLVRGNKVQLQLDAPDWIKMNPIYSRAFARGLFDTDGCVYLDVHIIKGRIYNNICIAFSNRSTPLRTFFFSTLIAQGMHPTQKSKYIVFLRREAEISLYFDNIGSSNIKHLNKFRVYMKEKEEYRRGRNGPHSKCG